MAPLYAHLGRDPVPSRIMKLRAPNVSRWVERMNLPSMADGEFPGHAESWLVDDAIPESLEPVIRLMFQDWGTQLVADAQFVNAWLQEHPNLPAGYLVSHDGERRVHPTLGMFRYSWRGATINRGSMPQGLWHFERGAHLARRLGGRDRQRFEAMVNKLGGEQVMQIKLERPIERQGGALVFGAAKNIG